MDPDELLKIVSKLENKVAGLRRDVNRLNENRPVVKVASIAKTMLTVPEAAEFLGMTVKGLRSLMHKHQIPYYKPNRKTVYFDPQELTEWMKQRKQEVERKPDTLEEEGRDVSPGKTED